jgi:hypothetical protein
MTVDEDGNIWSSAGDGVHCLSPQGDLLERFSCRIESPTSSLEDRIAIASLSVDLKRCTQSF